MAPSSRYPPLLPVIRALVERVQGHFAFRPTSYLVAVQHLVPDIEQLVGALRVLCLAPEHIFLLGKPYSTVPAVVASLQEQGVGVVPPALPPLGEYNRTFAADVQALWESFQQATRDHQVSELLVLDNGGMALTSVPAEVLARCPLVGEEQTTSGLYQLQERPLSFDVVSEASSAVKRHWESPLFTRAAVRRVIERFHSWQARRCGVVGLGAIGQALARELARQGCEVLAYDVADLPLPPDVPGTLAASPLSLLTEVEWLFGCTGRDVFADSPWPLAYQDGLKLASVSSGDIEFGALLSALRAAPQARLTSQADLVYSGSQGALPSSSAAFRSTLTGSRGVLPQR